MELDLSSMSGPESMIKRPLSGSVTSRTVQLFLLGSDKKAHIVLVGEDIKWQDFLKEVKTRLRLETVESVMRVTGDVLTDTSFITDMDKLIVAGKEASVPSVDDIQAQVQSRLSFPAGARATGSHVKEENGLDAAAADKQGDEGAKQQASCTACRLSKVRCDRQEPCSRCVRLGKVCIYSSRRRGRPPLAIRAAALARTNSLTDDPAKAKKINTILFEAIYSMSNNSCIPRFKLKRFCLYNLRVAVLKKSQYILDMSLKLMKRAGISLEELLGTEAASELTDEGLDLDTFTKSIVKHQAMFSAMRKKSVNQCLQEMYKIAPQMAGASITRVFHDGQLKYFLNDVAKAIFGVNEEDATSAECMDKDFLSRLIYPLDYKDMFTTMLMKYLAQFDAKTGPTIGTFEHVRWVDVSGMPFDAQTWICVETTESADLLTIFYVIPKYPSATTPVPPISPVTPPSVMTPPMTIGEMSPVPMPPSLTPPPAAGEFDILPPGSPGLSQLLGELFSEEMRNQNIIDQDLIDALDGIETMDNDWLHF